jgi:hypothetical protein
MKQKNYSGLEGADAVRSRRARRRVGNRIPCGQDERPMSFLCGSHLKYLQIVQIRTSLGIVVLGWLDANNPNITLMFGYFRAI